MRRKLIAGNWKMNGLQGAGVALAAALADHARNEVNSAAELLVCPPAQLLFPVAAALQGCPVALGGQDCHTATSGAHTGDISAEMLRDAGCTYVIVGHSERRADHGENDETVRAKAEAAQAAGLIPIVCAGETADQRAAGKALAIVAGQIEGSVPPGATASTLVIAYEPVWAIGTGLTATPDDVATAHAHIRDVLGRILGHETAEGTRILYGGSVKPENAPDLLALADVDGALVGGASLKADDFWAIGTS
ncbi:MAG: triose-phosphate isomerase [Alphaproteobacteria bacterium]